MKVAQDQACELYTFENPEQREIFAKITKELRCSVCQNESLSDSEALIAKDLKNLIYQKVLQQQTRQEIINFVASRYGDFVLYQPPFNWSTAILWVGPVILICIGLYGILKLIRPKNEIDNIKL